MGGFVITDNLEHKIWADKNYSILGSKKDIKIDNVFFSYYSNEETKPLKIVNDKCYILDGHLFNGDIDFAIKKYYENPDKFTEELDGQYTFIVYDIKTKTVHFYNDPFGCIPVYRTENTFHSFSPNVEKGYTTVEKHEYNTYCSYSYKDGKYAKHKDLHKWNLNQYKNNLDDVNKAFEESVLKCIEGFDNITLLLSSGWDSIPIAICLAENKKKFNAVYVNFFYDYENKNLINEVIDYCGEYINFFELRLDLDQEWHPRFRKLYPTEFPNTSRLLITTLDYIKENIADKLIIWGIHPCPLFDLRECQVFIDDDRTKLHRLANGRTSFTEVIPWPKNLEEVWDKVNWCSADRPFISEGGIPIEVAQYRDYNSFINRDIIGLTPYADKNLIQEWINTTQEIKAKEFRTFYKDYFRKRNITFASGNKFVTRGGLGRQMAVAVAALFK